MTQQQFAPVERYLEAFESFERNGSARDPLWVRALRKAAIARFNDLGFPTARRGNEEWKYTDVRPVARHPFQPPATQVSAGPAAHELEPFTLSEAAWDRLVFVDGRYDHRLSSLSPLPAGVHIANLAEAMAAQADLVEQHLARYADYQTSGFTALNTAFLHDGAFVHIPDGIRVERPIHLLFLSTSRNQDVVTHPRVLLLAGRESKATIIESYGGLSDGRYFTNAVTEVVVGPGAAMEWYRIQRESAQAFHVHTAQVTLARDSNFASVTVDLGGGLTRNNLNALMGGEGSSCMLNGLYMVTGAQHVDNQVIIDHAASYTTARELYKGILDGKSRAVFHGSIIVRKGLRKVNAHQEDKNLLLSDQAEADTKPAFWIYSDDVKCGHGAACGKLDEDALFYLRSRGIGEKEARTLLTRAFVYQVMDSIPNAPVRAHLDELVQATLQERLANGGNT